ncbi:MAG: hypothetical protein U1D32_00390, partial [Patescibacteria group bacterium]|nr:hypothetical protein [Patescibacteria group bacterium]
GIAVRRHLPMSGLADRTLAQAMDDARAIHMLNDVAEAVYTDARLLPVAAFVIGEIQDKFAEHDVPSKEQLTSALSYVADATSITTSGVTDFQAPLELWERATSGGEWLPMTRMDNLPAPLESPLDFLGMWEWSNDTLRVPACTTARSIYCRYRRQIPYPTDVAVDKVTSDTYYWAVVAGIAFYSLGGTERTERERTVGAIYTNRLLTAIRIASKDRQSISTRQQSARAEQRRPITISST